MTSLIAPPVTDERPEAGPRRAAAWLLGVAIEAGVLALVGLAPWAFGATPPRFVAYVEAGVAALTALGALRVVLEPERNWPKCPVAACLALLIVVGVCQRVPLSRSHLRRVSPVTARYYDRLLPAQPEVLPSGEPRDALIPPAGSTVSVYPGATRRELGRLLAALLLFVVVRANVAPAAGLWRLSLVAVANGSLLALFGLVQAFSSDPHSVYWIYPTGGTPFGPFINKNHFAFYVNVCVGLGVGLLLGRLAGRDAAVESDPLAPEEATRPHRRGHVRGGVTRPHRASTPWLDPASVGLTFALGLMITSVLFSLSRGGFLALVGGFLFGFLVWLPRLHRSPAGAGVLLALGVSLALVGWFGHEQVAARLATLRGGEALRDRRLAIWTRALPLVRAFPLWGTGYGTYEFVDTLHRSDAVDAGMIVDHAHNDFLELLVEGGLAGLVPGVTAVTLVFLLGLRAARRPGTRTDGALLAGALVALAAVTVHSFTDFSMHIPSCAVLVVVLAALLCGQACEGEAGEAPAGGRRPGTATRTALLRRGVATALGAGLMLALGLVLAHEAWRADRAQGLQVMASDLDRSGDPGRLERKVDHLEAAARWIPEDARLRSELVQAHLNAFEQQVYELGQSEKASDSGPPGLDLPGRGAAVEGMKRRHVIPALWHLLRSRDLCPLTAEVHMEIADHMSDLAASEPRAAYLERAELLAPDDPDLWFDCGVYALKDGRPDLARASWRRSLELSDHHLKEVLEKSLAQFGPLETVRTVLPDRPRLLLKAALELYPKPGEGRRPFLETALTLVKARPDPAGAEDLHLEASIQRALGRPAEALTAYRAALDREPLRSDWRYEHAELLYEQGRFEDASQELLKVSMLQPGNVPARALMDAVKGKLAEGR
jgi:O-antigen ligase/tetratricopeptide (TPR) repeat protein